MSELQIPRIRRAPLPTDAVVVVRGDSSDPSISRRQAETFRRRYPDWGRWGLSAFAARGDAEVDDLAADQLERFPVLSIYRVADLEALGFSIVPTFRTPHVTIALGDDLDASLTALAGAVHEQRVNSYHEQDMTEEVTE